MQGIITVFLWLVEKGISKMAGPLGIGTTQNCDTDKEITRGETTKEVDSAL